MQVIGDTAPEGTFTPVVIGASGLVVSIVAALPALAEETLVNVEASGDSNIVTTVIFTLAVIALLVLTLGVRASSCCNTEATISQAFIADSYLDAVDTST